MIQILKTKLKLLNLKRKLLINSSLSKLVKDDIESIIDDLNCILVKNAKGIDGLDTKFILGKMYEESKDSIGCSKEEWINHKTKEWCS